jgi:hypothetical protein
MSLSLFGGAEGGSDGLFALVMVGFIVFWGWQLVHALRGGPDWRSGRPGDPFRFSKWSVVVLALLAIVTCLALLLFR